MNRDKWNRLPDGIRVALLNGGIIYDQIGFGVKTKEGVYLFLEYKTGKRFAVVPKESLKDAIKGVSAKLEVVPAFRRLRQFAEKTVQVVGRPINALPEVNIKPEIKLDHNPFNRWVVSLVYSTDDWAIDQFSDVQRLMLEKSCLYREGNKIILFHHPNAWEKRDAVCTKHFVERWLS